MEFDKKKLEGFLKDPVDCCYKISANTHKLGSFGRELEEQSKDQCNEIERNNVSLAKSAEHLHTLLSLATECDRSSTTVAGSVNTGTDKMRKLSDNFKKMDIIFSEFTNAVESLQAVPSMAENVSKIADQAKMLALNARIEAARAGEQGRGFEIVSHEMSNLAQMSGKLGNNLTEITHNSVQVICEKFTNMTRIIGELNSISDLVAEDFRSLNSSANALKNNSKEVVSNCQGQEKVSVNIAESMGELQMAASVNYSGATDCVKSTKSMQSEVENLDRIVSNIIGTVTGTEVVDISPKDAWNQRKNFTIIDVRKPDEYRDDVGHIQGSTLMTIDQTFSEKVSKLPRDATYLFVCRSGGRSARAARIAMAGGIETIFNLEGGMLNWAKHKCPAIDVAS